VPLVLPRICQALFGAKPRFLAPATNH
jgi:hypothetical protein